MFKNLTKFLNPLSIPYIISSIISIVLLILSSVSPVLKSVFFTIETFYAFTS
jgi:hypothetical protein